MAVSIILPTPLLITQLSWNKKTCWTHESLQILFSIPTIVLTIILLANTFINDSMCVCLCCVPVFACVPPLPVQPSASYWVFVQAEEAEQSSVLPIPPSAAA